MPDADSSHNKRLLSRPRSDGDGLPVFQRLPVGRLPLSSCRVRDGRYRWRELDGGAVMSAREQIFRFDDGDETVTVKTVEMSTGGYCAFDIEHCRECDPVGIGASTIGAIADLFEKMPRAASEREERDHQADKWDHARGLRA